MATALQMNSISGLCFPPLCTQSKAATSMTRERSWARASATFSALQAFHVTHDVLQHKDDALSV